MPLSVEEAVLRIPQWAGAKELSITPLGGGITNNNYRIDIGNEVFVMRIPGKDTELLGINRDNEYAANLAASKLGIAPEVYYFIKPEGYLVTRFIHGRPLPVEEITQPENLCRVIQVIRRIHSMRDIPGRFDVFEVVRDYARTARHFKVEFPAGYCDLMSTIDKAENLIKARPAQLHPCHNDLLNANFLSNGQLYILDWEYAGMGDIFFDLANFSDHHMLTDKQDRWMLNCYFDTEATPTQWAYLKIMKIMSDLREASWGLVQMGIAKLDFDYEAYTNKFYRRVVEQINKPQWREWLKEVSKNE
jgi:thiamine kinase-like enzyme